MSTLRDAARRRFLARAAAVSVTGPAAPLALSLAGMSEAAAQSSGCTDYKALVCLFMLGGNDTYNTVLATDPDSWAGYSSARNIAPDPIALARPEFTGGVLPLSTRSATAGRSFALHPEMTHLQQMFNVDRKAAIVANVGPLVRPTTRLQYANASWPRPLKLFSHNDQQSTWQSFGVEGTTRGWGGRLIDLLAGCNTRSSFASVSLSGNVVWLSGQATQQYRLSTSGALKINAASGSLYGSASASATLRAIATDPRDNVLANEHARVVARSLATAGDLSTALSTGPAATVVKAPSNWLSATGIGTPVANPLAQQLNMVARTIAARDTLGVKRQVFFVGLGGFDTHDFQNKYHGGLLGRVSHAIRYFQDQMNALGIADKVTLFTASDFGRTLVSNGDGTDHGWGAHHFVTGGAVQGGDVYGAFPTIGLNTDTDVGRGALLPTVALDQYVGVMARWFGVPNTMLADVCPNLANFGSGSDYGLPASLAFMG